MIKKQKQIYSSNAFNMRCPAGLKGLEIEQNFPSFLTNKKGGGCIVVRNLNK